MLCYVIFFQSICEPARQLNALRGNLFYLLKKFGEFCFILQCNSPTELTETRHL